MGAKDLIQSLIRSNDFTVIAYLGDLSDSELLLRPAPGANHIAWQLGHLLKSEQSLLKALSRTTPTTELPAGWDQQYTAASSRLEPPTGFASKVTYLDLYKRSRANLLSVLNAFPEADLDKRTEGRLASIAPTLADMFVLIANHPMMHVGQWVVVRRMLGKPIVI